MLMRGPAIRSKPAPARVSVVMAGPPLPVWLLAALLALLTIVAYQPVWHAGFIWDDDAFLVDNPLIKAGDGLYRFWCTAAAPDYFPMTSTTLWLEWRFWGNHPLGYHLVNVVLHAASGVLLWRVLARLKVPGAWLAGAVFALHPVNVESVAWVTERKNTLAMFFYALALLWYVRSDERAIGGAREVRVAGSLPVSSRSWLFYWLSLGACGFALLSKAAVAPLPLVLLGLAWWRRGRIGLREVWRVSPFLGMAILVGLIAVWFQEHRAIGVETVRADSLGERLAGAGWAVWFYLCKALWPVNLMFVYPRWRIDGAAAVSDLPGLAAAAVLGVCWHYRRGWGRPVLLALGYFVVMLLPVLGFVDIYFMRYSLAADHWQYFAILGPIALVAAVLTVGGEVLGRGKTSLGTAAGGVLLLVLGVLTWTQARLYVDQETLWRDTLARNPACYMAHNNLGMALAKEGRIDEAMRQYQEAIRLKADDAESHSNLGIALAKKGQVDEGIRQCEEATRLSPDYPQAHHNLGIVLARKGQTDEAIRQYQEAIRLKPDYALAHYNLGNALYRAGRNDEAIGQYQETLRLKPDDALAHNNLGIAFIEKCQMDEAIRQFREAIRLKPDNAEARTNLARALELEQAPVER